VAGAQRVTVTPYRTSGIYDVGQTVGWTIALADGEVAAGGGYAYAIRKNNLVAIQSGSIDFAKGPAKIEATLDEPAMLVVQITAPKGAQGFGGRSTGGDGRLTLGAAVAPTRIPPAVPRPADFDAFWDAKLQLLAQVPANPVLVPAESGVPGVEYATLKMDNVGGAHVYGQLAKPKREGKFPALLILQWASPPYPLQKQWVTDRAAEGWLALNIEPHDVPSDMPQAFYDALPQLIKSYHLIGNTDRDRNYFLQMYLGDYRAVEYLAGRPDWNGQTLVVMGTSMGGQQSLSVAGLNPKVTAVIVNEPAGADANGALHGRAAGYPSWDVRDPRVMETARYFDVVNFASRIRATTLVAMGFIDDIAPPVGIWTAFNQIVGRKEAAPMVDSPHNNYATAAQQQPYTRRAAEWLDILVHGGTVTPRPLPR
jgi:cephalosporin-C deacetylase-like acetyl esterase